ncbi:DUF2169 family type VI secretion system accessory protein [Bordetella muralis]|uniref:DUF2169 family type VI secretion system accessory protein n=1 Tax=Bordetella muralis TaxID=1649130 RepID=UPI0039F06041
MKIIKPLRLMIMPRPYRWRNGKYLAVTVAVLIKDEAGSVSLLPEHTLLHEVLPALDSDEVLDFAMPKPNPEFLVSGYAYTNHQEDKTKCMVSVRVGDKKKEGLVFGDRHWIDGRISSPQPFESMPLNWSHSFGGPEYPYNPLGTGMIEREIDGVRAVWLPNLESPAERIRSRGQHVGPFNFGQIRIDWLHRFSKMGSYDEEWATQVGTGFFDDMDPTLFNSAADDQIWQERSSLSMDEPFELWNMHPEYHCWSGALPGLKARSFIRRRGSDTDCLDEIPMRATTVWFIPHQCRYVALFHGHIPIEEDDAFDVSAVMSALERINEPRPLKHYIDVFNARSNIQEAAFHALRDEELMPGDMLAPWFENDSLDQHPMLSRLGDRLGRHSDAYADKQLVGPIKPLALSDLPELAARNQSLHEKLIGEQQKAVGKRLNEIERRAELDSDAWQKELIRTLKNSLQNPREGEVSIPISGPPDVAPLIKPFKKLDTRRGVRRALVGASGDTSPAKEMYQLTKASLHNTYLYTAHYQQSVDSAGPQQAAKLRERVLWKHRLNKDLRNMNLTGANLSGMDLAGADFSGSWLEKVDFSNTNLADATFTETVLARGVFVRTNLNGASFNGTNISEATFEQASFTAARLDDLVCEKGTVFRSCTFESSVLIGFSIDKAELSHCSFPKAKLDNVTFGQSHIASCRFDNAQLDKINFVESCVEGVVIADSTVIGSMFTNLELSDFQIIDSVFIQNILTDDVKISGAVFTNSIFKRSLFSNLDFGRSSFEGSVFEQCNFSLSSLQQCNLRKVLTPQSNFTRANFDRSDLSGANLMHGNFSKASFVGSNLSACNLFQADMSEVMLDQSTLIVGANIKRTKVAPFRAEASRLPGAER